MQRQMPGGELEYAVLAALWELGSASVRAIYERVGQDDGLVYTTIAKVIDRLYAKQLVSRHRDGNAFIYRAAIRRTTVDRFRARATFGRLLGDDPRPVIASLVAAIETIDPALLEELSVELGKRRSRRRGT